MKKIRYNGHYLEIYDSITEMPITRFQAYNRFTLIDSGIGSGLEGVQKHIETLRRLLKEDKKEEIAKELNNFYQNLMFVVNNSNPEFMSFVCLIKNMNGRDLPELTADVIEKTIKKLAQTGFTYGKLRGSLAEWKKKAISNLSFFFKGFQTVPKQRSFSAI